MSKPLDNPKYHNSINTLWHAIVGTVLDTANGIIRSILLVGEMQPFQNAANNLRRVDFPVPVTKSW